MQAKPQDKPEPPLAHECCGGGSCCPCVWDSYYDKMRQWLEAQGLQVSTIKPTRDPDESAYR